MASSSVSPAHDPVQMLEILQRHLRPPEGNAWRVHACRIANARRRDGSRGTVEYEIRLEDSATGRRWDQKVTGITYGGERTRRAWQSIQRQDAKGAGVATRSDLPPFSYIPELDMLLQVFPHDHRLPALAQLLTEAPEALVPPLLAEFGPGDWQLAGWDADLVQYRVDMRAILRLRVRASDATTGRTGERHFYAKVYRDTEQERQSYQIQEELWRRTDFPGAPVTVARPIVRAEGLRTLLTTALPGVSLEDIIRRGQDVVPAVTAAARAVAAFHMLDIAAPPRPFADDIARLRDAEAILTSVRPDLAGPVSDAIAAIIAGLDGAPSALIHGDLQPDHILLERGRVALIDFDLAAVADPMIDIAHLLVYLGRAEDRAKVRSGERGSAGQVFVNEYFAHVPDAWRARLPCYHAMSSIHKAVGLSRKAGPGRNDHLEEVLREGQTFLSGGDGIAIVPSFKRRLTRPESR